MEIYQPNVNKHLAKWTGLKKKGPDRITDARFPLASM